MRNIHTSVSILIAAIAATACPAYGATDYFISESNEVMLHSDAPEKGVLSQAVAHYSMGLIYEQEGRLDKAIAEYREVIRLDPSALGGYIRLGASLLVSNATQEAISVLNKVKELDPSGAEAPFLLAIAYTKDKQLEKAAQEYASVLSQNPQNLRALSSLADLYVMQEKLEEAAGVYEQLLETEAVGEEPLIRFNLGIIYNKLDRTDDAIKNFEEAVKLNSGYLPAYTALAVLYEIKGDYEKAIKNFEEALKIEPLNRRLSIQLAELYYETGRKDDALHQYNLLKELHPDDADIYAGIASIAMKEKDYAGAEKALDEGMAKPAADAIKLERFKGFLYSVQNRFDDAAKVYTSITERYPEDAQSIFYLGAAYERGGKRAEAIEQFKLCLKLNPDNPEASNYLGYMYAEKGENLDEALSLIQSALKADPDNGAYVDSLGWVYYQKGMLEDALRELERAASIIKDDATVRDHLGDAYYKAGKTDMAVNEWSKAVALDPAQVRTKEKLEKITKERGISDAEPGR